MFYNETWYMSTIEECNLKIVQNQSKYEKMRTRKSPKTEIFCNMKIVQLEKAFKKKVEHEKGGKSEEKKVKKKKVEKSETSKAWKMK